MGFLDIFSLLTHESMNGIFKSRYSIIVFLPIKNILLHEIVSLSYDKYIYSRMKCYSAILSEFKTKTYRLQHIWRTF